jgi:hypothetical protein
MSERILSYWRASTLVLALWLAQSLSPSSAPAQSMAQLFIGQTNGMPGETVTISIDLANYTAYDFAAFDLLIGFDSSSLSLVNVARGPLLDQCGWQYFHYRTFANSGCANTAGDCPSQLLQIVAVADTPGNPQAACFLQNALGSLITLTFSIAPTTLSAIELPIRFYWTGCGDNGAASENGNAYFVHDVYDYGNSVPFPPAANLPGFGGLPESCFSGATQPPIQNLNFHDGVVYITDPSTLRGDLNLNALAYEVADLVVYENYFLNGISSFDPDPVRRQRQIVASDVNGDGVPLAFRDLVYLYRIIIGDTPPVSKSSAESVNASFIQDTLAATVTVASGSNLAGVLLRFEGLIEPTLNWPAQSGWISFWPDTAKNMTMGIWLGPDRSCCGTGTMLTYTGKGKLIQADAADWSDSEVKTKIIIAGATQTYGDVNGSGNINVADVIYLALYIFQGGAYPIDPYHGDMDCDGSCNIGDAIYLLNYIFTGGPAPCGIVR